MQNDLILGFDSSSVIAFSAGVWGVCLYFIYRLCSNRQSCGVPLAYAMLLSVIHAGALIYLLPWYNPLEDAYLAQQGASPYATAIGFAISTLAMLGLTFGVWMSDRVLQPRVPRGGNIAVRPLAFSRWLMGIGAAFFFVITPIANQIPSGASIASNGVNLAIVGICLFAYVSMGKGVLQQFRALLASLSIPGITMIFMGFVGYGVAAVTEIGCFTIKAIRVRWWSIPVGALLFWILLSFYVTYMTGRERIRESVWRGASMVDRVTAVAESFGDAQLFDPWDTKHLNLIDIRINQNALVGRSHINIHENIGHFFWGESLQVAALAWIPRVIWPSKPVFGGSGLYAAKFTGMTFSTNTSVGVGLVLEMYANFGLVGTFLGFWVFGILIRYVDQVAAKRLALGHLWEFAQFQLIGLAMIQPGGFLAECVASVAAAYVLTRVLRAVFGRASFIESKKAMLGKA